MLTICAAKRRFPRERTHNPARTRGQICRWHRRVASTVVRRSLTIRGALRRHCDGYNGEIVCAAALLGMSWIIFIIHERAACSKPACYESDVVVMSPLPPLLRCQQSWAPIVELRLIQSGLSKHVEPTCVRRDRASP